jgi:hypothetical protein
MRSDPGNEGLGSTPPQLRFKRWQSSMTILEGSQAQVRHLFPACQTLALAVHRRGTEAAEAAQSPRKVLGADFIDVPLR